MRGLLIAVASLLTATALVTSRGQVPDDADTPPTPIQPEIPTADRYESGRLFLERADRLLKPSVYVDYQVVTGDVLFRRGDMFMYCDSAHFYDQTNSLQAFGNVRMEQGDTLFVYADELVYTDSTQLAVLYADPGKKVRLINRDVELKTDIFNYDMNIELGYYEVGGELTDKQNRLTSVYGEYAPNTKDAIFRNNVHLNSLSKSDTLNIYTEALHYNTDTHIADLTDESTIISKDGTIYTANGIYNTDTENADLYDRSLVVTSTGKTLTGDTLFYDHKAGYGQAWGNMVLNDTVNKSRLLGDYGFYNELTDSAFVTGHALAVDYSSPDSLSLHGDTIQAFRIITITKTPAPKPVAPLDTIIETLDTIIEPTDTFIETVDTVIAPIDTILETVDTIFEPIEPVFKPVEPKIEIADSIAIADTTHYIVAYPNVRFYRSDLQGICDSMTFVQRDSLLYMDIDPIVWSEQRQIFGNQIIVHMNDSTADRVNLPDNAFMAEMIEPGYFNQISGREMIAYLADRTLRHVDVSGNVMLIFYPMEDDSTYNKIASAESSFLAADFDRGQIEKMKMWPQSTEVMTPLYLAKRSMFFLRDFRWEADSRPLGHDDLMPRPAPAEPAETPDNPDSSDPADLSDKSDNPDNQENPDTSDDHPTDQ